VEVNSSCKHSSLLRYGNNYGSKKFYSTGPWLIGKGAFEHKYALDIILLTFIRAKWMKSKPTLVQTFNEV
jgi:hypothetical protein